MCRHLALHGGAVNAADVIHPIDELATSLVNISIKRLSQIAWGDLKMLILRLRGRADRNNTDSSGKDCRRKVFDHSCLPPVSNHSCCRPKALLGKTRQL